MQYYSTNRSVPEVSLGEALLEGQAGDRGLYLPREIPQFEAGELAGLVGKSYPEIAEAVLSKFTAGVFGDEVQRRLCEDAYGFDVPLEKVTGRRYVMRLDRGPTASFKDFAARMMARWMSALMEREDGELVILTATSGDTGSAVAHAFHGVDRVRVVVLFPIEEVSDRQRKQMTTLGGNVETIGIDAKFDDGQAMVKRAFADPELSAIRLTSANSINIGRLLPQAVYYVYAYVRLADMAAGEEIVFSVPSGNFGDMMGGVIARKMGLPIRRFVIATNENDEFPKFLRTGTYEPIAPSRKCISNAMNVGHPSNLARLVDLYGGWMDETGVVKERPDVARMQKELYSVSVTDEETRATIKRAWEAHGLILEPHGAVGWKGLESYLEEDGSEGNGLCVSLETAHPAKFPEEIKAMIGVEPETPASLEGLEAKEEMYSTMAAEYEAFRDHVRERYSARVV